MKKILLLHVVFTLATLGWSCRNAPREQTIVSGRLKVLVDETLLPVMEEEVEVFEHLYERAEVTLESGPEIQVINQLLSREVEVVVLTRALSEREMEIFHSRRFTPWVHRIGTDGVALVVGNQTADTVVTLDVLTSIMRGEEVAGPFDRLVFDNPNSSTVRLLRSIAGVDSLPQRGVYALRSTFDVLKYVSENRGAIGAIGLSWIVRPDTTTKTYLSGLKVLGVRGKANGLGSGVAVKPSQSDLADSLYALARPIYIINAEPRKSLGMGFAAFLTGDVGQRVLLKAGLMPDSVPPREIIIRN